MHTIFSFEHICKVWDIDQIMTRLTNYTDFSFGFDGVLKFIQFNMLRSAFMFNHLIVSAVGKPVSGAI